jgi:hypothetical protein
VFSRAPRVHSWNIEFNMFSCRIEKQTIELTFFN